MMVAATNEHIGYVRTATIVGVKALPVTVEVHVGWGLPGIWIVGMPDTAVNEARLRVKLALKAAGFRVPNDHVVINLAPSSEKKTGSGFDLPIALGFLLATGQINAQSVQDVLCIGELSLDGSVRPVKGLLAYEHLAHESNLSLMTAQTERGVYAHEQQEHLCLAHLADLHDACFSQPDEQPLCAAAGALDYAEIAGNELAKRALQIAAAGSHGLLMVGPPGSGKSMMAQRLSTILPPLSLNDRLESAMIHSVAGLPYGAILQGQRPFRAPHHGASRAGLLGGGNPTGPGEVSLAHNGVLFLDEMPEFGSSVLQLLRQPMELGSVSLARAGGTIVFPSRFMLVAAANPCSCGYYGDAQIACTCTPAEVTRYQNRIGGPLMDRFDLVVDVWRSDPSQVLATGTGTSSQQLREGVLAALEFRRSREEAGASCDASSESCGSGEALLNACKLDVKAQAYLEALAHKHQLSGRGIMRSLSVARTIADLDQKPEVKKEHLFEAVNYRAKSSESS